MSADAHVCNCPPTHAGEKDSRVASVLQQVIRQPFSAKQAECVYAYAQSKSSQYGGGGWCLHRHDVVRLLAAESCKGIHPSESVGSFQTVK